MFRQKDLQMNVLGFFLFFFFYHVLSTEIPVTDTGWRPGESAGLDCLRLVFPDRQTVSCCCCRHTLTQFDVEVLTVVGWEPLRTSSSLCTVTEPSPSSPGVIWTGAATLWRILNKRRPKKSATEQLLRNEFERALAAGAVLEKALPEPSQAESHQPNFCSAVRLRYGESRWVVGYSCAASRNLLK